MRRLAGAHELLDGPLDESILASNLRDLTRVNRWLGGADLSRRALSLVPVGLNTSHPLRVLDVGTGAADIPLVLAGDAARAGRRLEVVAADTRPEVVAIARRNTASRPEIRVELVPPDGLPWPDRSFDVVHASLLLHHFDMRAAIDGLAEMRRVAGRAVIVNDLQRARRWWLGAWLLSRLGTRNVYTRHDAPLSVRRAWTADEASAMAARAGLRETHRLTDRLGHRYALVLVSGG